MYEVREDSNLDDGAIEEQGKPYRGAIPKHPAELLSSPLALSTSYRRAASEIYRMRKTTERVDAYSAAIQEAAFHAFLNAVGDGCSAIVGEHHSGWRERFPERRDIYVVASGPGSGKSTLARAFAIALQRETEEQPYPLGSVFLVHHIETAHKAYQELSALLPGKVAVFSTKHDAERDYGYSDRYAVGDLEAFPIVVVTHEFYMGLRGERARYHRRNGFRLPRVLTFIDEKVKEIDVHDLTPAALESVLDYVQQDQHASPEIVKAMHELLGFIQRKRFGEKVRETQGDDLELWQQAVQATACLRDEAAEAYARSAAARKPRLNFEAVFGFNRAMAESRAFIERKNGGLNGAYFVGYERALARLPGMVLLDATANVDGIDQVSTGRKHANVPTERYARLEIVHVPSVATGTLRRWLQKSEHVVAYVEQIRNVIRHEVACGQKALVVCTKDVVEAKVPNWSEHMLPFLNRTTSDVNTKPFAWNMDGREMAVTWYGGYGIGANDWKEADVVLLFDDFHLPTRAQIATLQGLRGHCATEGLLADSAGAAQEELRQLSDGHVLRWLKQMAMRGRGRDLDEHGVGAPQKLVVTGDLVRLVKHRNPLFPGAKLSLEPNTPKTLLQRLIYVLADVGEGTEVSTKLVAERLGRPWRDISGNLSKTKGWKDVVEGIGWTYHAGSGSKPGSFRRVTGVPPVVNARKLWQR
jgi:energy-coupling factor transporter ATP-binding protein EcfA2